MSYAPIPPTATRRAVPISPLSIEAELSCMMCGRVVGEVVRGRAIQHRGCTGRLRVERGILRCCHCNGPVYRDPLMALDPR